MPSTKPIIPKEDVKLINDAFSVKKESKVITKNAKGEIIKPKKQIVNSRGYAITSFMGRTIKHNKSFIKRGQPQILAAKAGMLYEDVPVELRNQVTWKDSDFI